VLGPQASPPARVHQNNLSYSPHPISRINHQAGEDACAPSIKTVPASTTRKSNRQAAALMQPSPKMFPNSSGAPYCNF